MEDNKSTFARSKNNAKSTINNIGIAYEVEYKFIIILLLII